MVGFIVLLKKKRLPSKGFLKRTKDLLKKREISFGISALGVF
jgi:hypothetical protein